MCFTRHHFHKVFLSVDMQSAAELHQLQAHHGGDAAGLPILVPTLAAQMLNKKYGIGLLQCTFIQWTGTVAAVLTTACAQADKYCALQLL